MGSSSTLRAGTTLFTLHTRATRYQRRDEVVLCGDAGGVGVVPGVTSVELPRALHTRVLQEPGGDSLLRRGQVRQVRHTLGRLLPHHLQCEPEPGDSLLLVTSLISI